jgi:hypothetical protein
MGLLPFICKGKTLTERHGWMGFKSPRLRPRMPGNSTKLPGIPPKTEKIPPRPHRIGFYGDH